MRLKTYFAYKSFSMADLKVIQSLASTQSAGIACHQFFSVVTSIGVVLDGSTAIGKFVSTKLCLILWNMARSSTCLLSCFNVFQCKLQTSPLTLVYLQNCQLTFMYLAAAICTPSDFFTFFYRGQKETP